jgi:hypothetical protein
MPGPIKPTEVQNQKDVNIPEEVFNIFNDLITLHWNGISASVPQSEIIARLTVDYDISRQEVFNRGYLEIEFAYRRVGWKVRYEKPDPNDSWGAYFVFSK